MSKLKNGHLPKVLATEYASYRDSVIEVLREELLRAEDQRSLALKLYDPMAGTASLLPFVEERGYTAYFNDLNPLHGYVNAAKTFDSYRAYQSLGESELLSALCDMAPEVDRCARTPTADWFEPAVLEALAHTWERVADRPREESTIERAVLLLSLRSFSSFAKSGNPTWLRPGGLRPKVRVKEAFLAAMSRLRAFYAAAYRDPSRIKGGRARFTDYDAMRSKPKPKVDVVVTSPPFCNRVDWDRLYAPEHSFLNAVGAWHTSAELLGTTVVRAYTEFEFDTAFVKERSSYLRQFLKEVRGRQIRRERGSDYYVKYFTRYFAGLFRVFDLATKSLRTRNAGVYFVVQDSRHRGLQVDIGKALTQSLTSQGFQVVTVEHWDRHHMGLRNVSRRHRVANPKQREQICHAQQ